MDNSGKIILDLCGGSGAWSRPYREAGYDVRVLTLPTADVTSAEFGEKRFWIYNANRVSAVAIEYENVHGIFAAPPCTEFSRAKGGAPRDHTTAIKIVKACLEIVWHCRINGQLRFWALENPVGQLRQFIGIPRFSFYQWEFGAHQSKHTDVWGYFNEPTKTVHERPDIFLRHNPCGSSNGRNWGKLEYPPEYEEYIKTLIGYTAQRAAARAITPEGFAKAFFRANK